MNQHQKITIYSADTTDRSIASHFRDIFQELPEAHELGYRLFKRNIKMNRHSDEALAEEESGNKKQNNENATPNPNVILNTVKNLVIRNRFLLTPEVN